MRGVGPRFPDVGVGEGSYESEVLGDERQACVCEAGETSGSGDPDDQVHRPVENGDPQPHVMREGVEPTSDERDDLGATRVGQTGQISREDGRDRRIRSVRRGHPASRLVVEVAH